MDERTGTAGRGVDRMWALFRRSRHRPLRRPPDLTEPGRTTASMCPPLATASYGSNGSPQPQREFEG